LISLLRWAGSGRGAICFGCFGITVRLIWAGCYGESIKDITLQLAITYLLTAEIPIALRIATELFIFKAPPKNPGIDFFATHRHHLFIAVIILLIVISYHLYHAF